MAVTGSEIQEKRLEEMGRLAEQAAPGFGVVAFSGRVYSRPGPKRQGVTA